MKTELTKKKQKSRKRKQQINYTIQLFTHACSVFLFSSYLLGICWSPGNCPGHLFPFNFVLKQLMIKKVLKTLPRADWICACLILGALLSLCSFFFPKDGKYLIQLYSMHRTCLRMSCVRKSSIPIDQQKETRWDYHFAVLLLLCSATLILLISNILNKSWCKYSLRFLLASKSCVNCFLR
jgi:hypothetical protein